jgi:hypothetical protein
VREEQGYSGVQCSLVESERGYEVIMLTDAMVYIDGLLLEIHMIVDLTIIEVR